MKKRAKFLYSVLLVFVAVIIISYDEIKEKEDTLLSASYVVSNIEEFEGTRGIIESASYYGNEYLEDDKKVNILKGMAEALGITGELTVSSVRNKNRETVTLSKMGEYSETVLNIVTLEEQDSFGKYSFAQYITCKIYIDNSPESVCYYTEVLKNYLKGRGLSDEVTSTLISYFDEELDVKKLSNLTNKLLECIDAKVVAENRTKELFSVYAYSENIEEEDTINLGGMKANINIAANYNEALNQTRIYLAIPIIEIEY